MRGLAGCPATSPGCTPCAPSTTPPPCGPRSRRGARTVVVGAGFIGSEVASGARGRGLPATIVEALPTPLVRAVGEQMGAALSRLHEAHGTDLRCGVASTPWRGPTGSPVSG